MRRLRLAIEPPSCRVTAARGAPNTPSKPRASGSGRHRRAASVLLLPPRGDRTTFAWLAPLIGHVENRKSVARCPQHLGCWWWAHLPIDTKFNGRPPCDRIFGAGNLAHLALAGMI